MTTAALIANKSKEISRLNSVYVNLLKNAGVTYIEGKGSLLDAHTVQVLARNRLQAVTCTQQHAYDTASSCYSHKWLEMGLVQCMLVRP